VVVTAHSCVLSWWQAVHGVPAPAAWTRYARVVKDGLREADLVVAATETTLAACARHYGISSPTRVIPHQLLSETFRPRAKEEVIFTSGRVWDEGKNLELLDRISPFLPWPVRCAGERGASGCPAGTLEFLGELDLPARARALSTAALYAAPARYEPFGLGILEAAASGCALVLGDIGTLRDQWGDAALFVDPDDRRGWTLALRYLIDHPRERERLADAALERARAFSPELWGLAYLEVYAQAALRRQGLKRGYARAS
jgi:glycosyltransferase involved in cell wall biosynthesis